MPSGSVGFAGWIGPGISPIVPLYVQPVQSRVVRIVSLSTAHSSSTIAGRDVLRSCRSSGSLRRSYTIIDS
eukprot:COSAG05_NODE_512_length_9090_cov_33.937827_10_plen_71_part_00